MSRRNKAEKREVIPDPVYKCTVISSFINRLMKKGKKAIAEKIVYKALDKLAGSDKKKSTEASGEASVEKFKDILEKLKPVVEVRSRRVGGATFQVPVEVRPERATALAMRWLITAAKQRSEKTMAERLAGELKDAAENRGSAIKKREDTHRMAEANKAFAHYRW